MRLSRSNGTQSYRVEWYPFARGTVSIGTVYDENLDAVSKRRFRRGPAPAPLNKHAIDLNYTIMSTYEGSVGDRRASSLSNRKLLGHGDPYILIIAPEGQTT